MNNRAQWGFLAVLTGAILAVIMLFYKPAPVPSIPHIVTHYDTVEVTPKWLQDSQKVWKKRVYVTDTVNIVLTNTIVRADTTYISADTGVRPQIWPVLRYRGAVSFGDTGMLESFSLRSGEVSVSKLFIPGILTAIEVDSTALPRMSFEPFPEPSKPPLLYRLKLFGYGFGACSILGSVR